MIFDCRSFQLKLSTAHDTCDKIVCINKIVTVIEGSRHINSSITRKDQIGARSKIALSGITTTNRFPIWAEILESVNAISIPHRMRKCRNVKAWDCIAWIQGNQLKCGYFVTNVISTCAKVCRNQSLSSFCVIQRNSSNSSISPSSGASVNLRS